MTTRGVKERSSFFIVSKIGLDARANVKAKHYAVGFVFRRNAQTELEKLLLAVGTARVPSCVQSIFSSFGLC